MSAFTDSMLSQYWRCFVITLLDLLNVPVLDVRNLLLMLIISYALFLPSFVDVLIESTFYLCLSYYKQG